MIAFIDQFLTIIGYYASVSLVAFAVYGWDKRAAEKNASRVPENTLYILNVVGGWPGALLARQYWRHKTIKKPFKIIFNITAALNIFLLIWFLLPAK